MSLTNGRTEIWLKWWAQADSTSNGAKIGTYLGVYVTLSLLGVAMVFTGVWYVYSELNETSIKLTCERFMFVIVVPISSSNLHKTLITTTMKLVPLVSASNGVLTLM